MHLLCHDWMVLTCIYMSYSYTPWILNVCTEHGKWSISTKLYHVLSYPILFNNIDISHPIATTKYWVLRKYCILLLNHYWVNFFIGHLEVKISASVHGISSASRWATQISHTVLCLQSFHDWSIWQITL